MIVKTRKEALVVGEKGWKSERLLLKKDGMGFSFHITTIEEGTKLNLHYQNHLESVYCIRGEGEITDLATNKTYPIQPGTIYALNKHDKHIVHCIVEMEFACVFNPPCSGEEKHDENGAYASS